MNFAIIGVAGYIAPRHLQAIKETGNILVAALDKNDSVGILDKYFPEADFFTEPERFDRHLDKLRRDPQTQIHYVSICTPNYLHDAHIRMSLRNGANAICEKPIVLNPWNVEKLCRFEEEIQKHIYAILQLRYHEAVLKLRQKVLSENIKQKYDIELTYITGRGKWYFYSWKGDESKSGGVVTNIGIHFFDMLLWIFGKVQESVVHYKDEKKVAGFLELEKARVRWFLSVDFKDLPEHLFKQNKRTYRSLLIQGEDFDFSEGFENLHTVCYQHILDGKGYRIAETYDSINLTYNIRNAALEPFKSEIHPLTLKYLK